MSMPRLCAKQFLAVHMSYLILTISLWFGDALSSQQKSKIKKKNNHIPSDECGLFHPILLPSGLMLKRYTFSTVYSWERYYWGGLGASVNSAPFWSVRALQPIWEN